MIFERQKESVVVQQFEYSFVVLWTDQILHWFQGFSGHPQSVHFDSQFSILTLKIGQAAFYFYL